MDACVVKKKKKKKKKTLPQPGFEPGSSHFWKGYWMILTTSFYNMCQSICISKPYFQNLSYFELCLPELNASSLCILLCSIGYKFRPQPSVCYTSFYWEPVILELFTHFTVNRNNITVKEKINFNQQMVKISCYYYCRFLPFQTTKKSEAFFGWNLQHAPS